MIDRKIVNVLHVEISGILITRECIRDDELGGIPMIQWASKLYIGDQLMSKKDKAIRKINKRKVTNDVYCIAFASSPQNLFDIMNANELLFPYYKKADIKIVGLSKGENEALYLVQDMLMEVYHNTGDFNVREYFT